MTQYYKLPEKPTTNDLQNALQFLANNMSKLADQLSTYKTDVAYANAKYKRAYARALVKNQNAKNATMVKALAEIDELVVVPPDELNAKNAIYTIAEGEYEGMETQFVAIRKIVEIQKLEYKGEYGNGA